MAIHVVHTARYGDFRVESRNEVVGCDEIGKVGNLDFISGQRGYLWTVVYHARQPLEYQWQMRGNENLVISKLCITLLDQAILPPLMQSYFATGKEMQATRNHS